MCLVRQRVLALLAAFAIGGAKPQPHETGKWATAE